MTQDDADIQALLDADRGSMDAELDPATSRELLDRLMAGTMDRAPSWRDRLRELPTGQRRSMAITSMVVVGGAYVVLGGMRPDLSPEALRSLVFSFGAMTLVGGFAARVALRGAWEGPLSRAAHAGVAVCLCLPFAVSWLPGIWPGHIPAAEAAMLSHLRCGSTGLLAASALTTVLLIFDRSERPEGWRLLAASGAGGVAGFVAQGMTCASNDTLHLVFTHGTYGLLVWLMLRTAVGLRAERV